jgi:hypothetical protein
MSEILLRVQQYLDKINFGSASCDPKLIEEFGERAKELLSRKLNEKADRKFSLRMSNIGRPLCQLQAQKFGFEKEYPDNFFQVRMMFGDIIEVLAIIIMKAAGINIQSEQVLVSSEAGIEGTFDVEIEDKIWDIKSASPFAFEHKFKGKTIQDLWRDDSFGYVCQGIGYATSVGKRFGGWIVIDKVSGEWTVLEAKYDEQFEQEVLAKIAENTRVINSDEPFKRDFDDIPELHYKRPTGNRILSRTCGYCPYKRNKDCFPEAQQLPSQVSTAKNKQLLWYTYVQPKESIE